LVIISFRSLNNLVTLNQQFCSMFGLETGIAVLFVICVLAVCIFEFANGFHDTANAVATVIYTGAMRPTYAVVWSGFFNFLGLIISGMFGYKVAMGIVNLLPLSDMINLSTGESVSLVLGMLLSGIFWNIGTWYLGIPCSSSHTLIGSILGAGLVFYWLHGGDGVNWGKASEIGLSLFISPLFGFSVTILLMYILRRMVKTKKQIFKEPEPGSKPPIWIRIILICTCTLVSFFHGNNDGQKGIGLMLIILITFMPVQFTLAPRFDADKSIQAIEKIDVALSAEHKTDLLIKTAEVKEILNIYKAVEANPNRTHNELKRAKIDVRTAFTKISKKIGNELKNNSFMDDKANAAIVKSEIKIFKEYTEFSPTWVTIMIALCLGMGTMIGWKRIAVTIGEKIGKRHMTYAEGATAELTAAATIGMSSAFGLPVSTTHVLSSGVAGAMTASKGVKNLQPGTIRTIALAWILTLPVTIILAGGFYYVLQIFLK
jgi:PiT family inorganic phosphate transporter